MIRKNTIVIIVVLLLMFVVALPESEAFLGLLFPDHFNKLIIPTEPNPVVFMVKNKQLDELQMIVTNALKNQGYTIKTRDSQLPLNKITAVLFAEPRYVHPTEADVMRAQVSVAITPEGSGMHLVSVKGERFDVFVHGKHKPVFVVAGEVARALEQQLVSASSVVVTDGDVPSPPPGKFFAASTDYTTDDISEIKVYCKPNDVSRNSLEDYTLGQEFILCQKQIEILGGYVKYLGSVKVVLHIDSDYLYRNQPFDHVRKFQKYREYYKFTMDLLNATDKPESFVAMPYELMTVIKFKDGKQLKMHGLREDIFRKRLF